MLEGEGGGSDRAHTLILSTPKTKSRALIQKGASGSTGTRQGRRELREGNRVDEELQAFNK